MARRFFSFTMLFGRPERLVALQGHGEAAGELLEWRSGK
jgi:hypothetical protein